MVNPTKKPLGKRCAADACDVTGFTGDSSLFLESQLCFTLYSASLAMTKRYRSLLAEIGITYPQYVVMLALWQGDGLTVTALGARVALDSGTLTPLLKRLEKAGFLSRTRNPDDEREVRVALTAAGRRCYEHAGAIKQQASCATRMSAGSAQKLIRSLARLRVALGEPVDGV